MKLNQDDNIKISDFDLQKKFPGYFNKWVFRAGVLILVLIFCYALFITKFSTTPYVSITCNSPTPCQNDFYTCNHPNLIYYQDCTKILKMGCDNGICDKELLQPGETIGRTPPPILKHFLTITIIIIACCFLVNHILYKVKKK
jgi:hypothetical protein